jgi:hypothetical protein
MVAVGQLANGLLGSATQQLGGTTSSADLDPGRSPSPTPAATASASPTTSPSAAASPQNADSTLLTSADGSVLATCQAGGAYLIYWSPAQGFSADDVARGPAAVTSVTFENRSGGLSMRVSCPSGTPVASVRRLSAGPEPSDNPSANPSASPSGSPSGGTGSPEPSDH